MTREEAVSIIEDRVRVTEYVNSSYVDCVDIEALKMAINALTAQSTIGQQNDGDTICKQDAINAALECRVIEVTPAHMLIDKTEMVTKLLALPSAQPERKTGEWIERNPRNSPNCRLIECSECGNAYIVGYNIDYDDWIDGRNFCMKCGADLRGGSNDKST